VTAYWGIVHASGLNYNKTWAVFDAKGLQKSAKCIYQATRQANTLAHSVDAWKNGVVESIQHYLELKWRVRDLAFTCLLWNSC